MAVFESRRLVLSRINYKGANLGSRWRVDIETEGTTVSIHAELAHRKATEIGATLLLRNIASGSDLSHFCSVSVAATEVDGPLTSDSGRTTKPWLINTSHSGTQEFVLPVTGVGGAENKKVAELVFVFESVAAGSGVINFSSSASRHVSVAHSAAANLLPFDLAVQDSPALAGLASGNNSALAVKITLIGIQNKGQGIGSDLSINININNYGQGIGSFKPDFKKAAAKTDVPVFNHVFQDGFDARLGVTIHIVESDPVYDDEGWGGGFIDTYLEGIQTITVPLAAEGGDVGRVALFEFSFLVQITEYQTDHNGTSTTGGGVIGGTTSGGTIIGGTTTGTHPPSTTGPGTTPPEEPPVVTPPPPPPPPPPPECEAEIIGPSCTCIDGVYQYSVASNCEGEVVDWLLEDEDGNPSSVAKIVYEDKHIARVLILDNGVFNVKCYYLFKGREIAIELTKEVDAVGISHVIGGTSDVVTDAVPMVQPHPYVQIDSPRETDTDECLVKGIDFIVHENKLQDAVALLHHTNPDKRINLEQIAKNHLEVQLKVKGIFQDFFLEMNRCEWKVVSKGGRHTDGGKLRKKKDFTDSTFETTIPGEKKVASHVVVLQGTGGHEVRVIGHNAIERPGTDWVIIHVDLGDDAKKEIADLQRQLSDLMSQTPAQNQLAAHAKRIANTQIAIEKSYIRGLANPCLTCKHNHQEAPVFAHPDSDKTRTQGRYSRADGPDEIPATVKTPVETHDDLVTIEEKPLIYLNQKPVKNYWVTKEIYAGKEYKWTEDGIIRGRVDEDVTSRFICCDRGEPVFGVEAEVPDCIELNAFSQTILLKAKGIPAVSPRFNNVGQYRWSVIAKPDKDAQVEITPDNWTQLNTAQLKVDTSGRYTVKVEYQLGRDSALTFAVADIKVIKNSDFILKWEVRRAGGYGGELQEHVALPLYQERKDDAIKAADMLITPVAQSGTALLVAGGPIPTGSGSATPSGNTMGKSFEAAFLVPQEIEFEQQIRVRAYFKPYSPSLGAKDYQDFVGDPAVNVTPAAPFQLLVNIKAEKEIHAVHLLNIRYKHAQRFKGQAIPISFAYRLPEDEVCPHQEVYTIQNDNGWRTDNPPLVNVITYNRDLGDAQSSNAYVGLSNAGDYHNTANGNVYFELNLLESSGHGINQKLDLHYNSLQASYQDSLEFYRMLNGVSQDVINRHWCRNFIGMGWLSSYHLTVRYYVVPLDINGRVKELYAEVVAPDGNRIQFKQTGGGTDAGQESGSGSTTASAFFDGEYRPLFGSDYWMGSAEMGHTLLLRKQGTESILSDINHTQWKFNKFGLLEEISNPLTRNTVTEHLRVNHTANKTTITDSCGRVTRIETIPEDRSDYAGELTITLPENEETKLTISRSRLTNIDRSSIQAWGVEYHDKIGQGNICSLIKTLTDPLATQANFEFYTGDAFGGVPESVARNFWGRLSRYDKGATQNRVKQWLYEGFDPNNQKLIFKNAVGIDFVQVLDLKRLALKSLSYINKRRSNTSKELLSTPNYSGAAQDSDQYSQTLVTTYKYHESTKLLSETTDIHGEKIKRSYFKLDERRYLLEEITFPDLTKTKFEYDLTSRLPRKIYSPRKANEASGTRPYTEYRYNKNQQVTTVIHPSLRIAGGNEINDVKERWKFDASGRLEEYHDINNSKRVFGYREEGRDPQGVDLPTSVKIDMGNNVELISRVANDIYGREILTYDPKFGTTTEFTYHKLGELEREILQPIPTANGRTEGAIVVNTYDAMGNHTAQVTPIGTEAWIPNEHSEVWWHFDYDGNKTVTEYHPSGSISRVTNPGGGITQFRYDELGRVIRKHYPQPDNRSGVRHSEAFTVVLEYKDSEKTIVAQRRKLRGNGLGDVVVENTDTFKNGKVHIQTTKTGAGPAFEKVVFLHDRWGQPREIQWHDGDTLKKRLIQVRDDWGREIQQTHCDKNRRIKRSTFVSYFNDGRIQSRTHERISGTNEQPESHFTYDRLGRLLSVKDKNNHVIQKLVYNDFGNDPAASHNAQIVELSPDPSADIGRGGLQISRVYTYNRRGLVVVEDTDVNPNLSLRNQKHYDAFGRMVKEIQSDGTVLEFGLDALGRIEKIEREAKVRDPSLSLHYLRAQSDPASTRRVKTVIQETTYAWHGQIATQKQGALTTHFEYDQHGRLLSRSEQDDQQPQLEREVLTYDALDRVKRREVHGGGVQTYVYDDGQRKVELHWRYSTTDFRATAHLNWAGQLTDYRIDSNRVGFTVSGNYQDPFVALKYEYNDIGDLTSKIYLREGHGNQEFGRIDYRYNAVGMLYEQDVIVTSVDGNKIKQERKYTFDANQHLTEIHCRSDIDLRHNKWKKYSFHYNNAGFLKQLDRPHWSTRNTDYGTYGIRTLYDHDSRGRLTLMREGIFPSDPQFEDMRLELHYSRPSRQYICGSFPVVEKDISTAQSLKGVTYRLKYHGMTRTYTQDYMYDGLDNVETQVTSFTGHRAERKEDWRTQDVNPADNRQIYSYRRYASARTSFGSVSEYNYVQHLQFNRFGGMQRVTGTRVATGPFDNDLGSPGLTSPQGRKSNFVEERGLPAFSALPTHSILITENSQNDTTTPLPGAAEVHKGYRHNAADQLVASSHQLLRRVESTTTFHSSIKSSGHSLENYALFFYEPDGSQMVQVEVVNEVSSTNHIVVSINDGGTLLAEYDLFTERFQIHDSVPGVGVRLGTTIGRFADSAHDHELWNEFYYHWNHNGAPTYLTSAETRFICADFRFATAEGEADLFGESFNPEQEPQVLSGSFRNSRHGISPWDFYHAAPMSVDMALGQVGNALDRNEHLLSMAADVSNPPRSVNRYGMTLAPFGYPVEIPSYANLIYHSVLDLVRGIGDALTIGYASKWRNAIYDHDQDLAGIRNPMTYIAGQITGTIMSIYFSFAAVPLRAAQATWATRAAMLLTVTADIVTFAHSVQAIRSGKATFFDYVGLAAPLSVASALKIQHARNTKVINSIDKARNAVIEQIISKSDNLFHVLLRPTQAMLSDAQIINDLKKYFPVAEVLKKGRQTPVKHILGDEIPGSSLTLGKATYDALKKMGVTRRRHFKTVGQVDAVYRKVWRKLLKEAGENLDGIAAGHRIDLGINRFQAAFEVRMFKWAMEGLVEGNPNIKQWLMDLFAKHGSTANSSVGSGVTKQIMNHAETGTGAKIILEFLG